MKTNKKGVSLGILIIVMTIVLLIAAAFFYISYNKKEKLIVAEEIFKPAPKFEIVDLRLCDSIDENFNCKENVGGEFAPISFMDILIQIEGLKSKKVNGENKIAYTQNREIVSQNNEIIESDVILDKEELVDDEGFYPIKIKNNVVILSSAELGEYTLKISVTDKNTGKTIVKSKKFTIK